ncbi:MAG: bacterioferritin [Acidimicrobiales bacterium]|nr:bacterioferritin [Acidimicrobiales bacterium]
MRSPAVVAGNPEVLELLNEVLTSELTAVNQYFAHAKLQEHWGYGRLAAHSRDESMEEMRHAEAAIERILYLEGVPNLQRLGSVRVGEAVPEQLRLDLELEVEALTLYRRGVVLAERLEDHGTRELLVGLLRDEERHADWLETQLTLIESLGEANYLSQQLHG